MNSTIIRGSTTGKHGAMIPDGSDFRQIWRLLNNIKSSNSQLLRVTYSAGGIMLQPRLYTPFMGEIDPDDSTGNTIVVGRHRTDADYPFDDIYLHGLTNPPAFAVTWFNTPDTVNVSTKFNADGEAWVFYNVDTTDANDAGDGWNYSLFASGDVDTTAASLDSDNMTGQIFLIGKAQMTADLSKIQSWTQYHTGILRP